MFSPGNQVGRIKLIEKIESLHTIDWGPNHVIFVDKKSRVFSLGDNKFGKTGLGLTVTNERWHNDLIEMDS